MTLAKVFSSEFYEVFDTTYFVEYLQTAASELVSYQAHILLSEVRLEEEEYIRVYKNYLRMTPEFFDKLFVLSNVLCTFS